MGNAMKEASEKASGKAAEFAHDHPYFCASIAVGILVILMPWALEALGLAELGPVEDERDTSRIERILIKNFRNVCCLVVVDLLWLCDEGNLVLVLSAPRIGLALIGCVTSLLRVISHVVFKASRSIPTRH